MANFTFSFDFIENAKPDYLGMLYTLINPHCLHSVAVDKDLILLELYEKKCKYGDIIASWVRYIEQDYCEFTKAENYSIKDPENISDKDIYGMTLTLIGERMMIMHNLQKAKQYVKQEEMGAGFSIVDCKYADNYINSKEITINKNIHSIVANNGSTIEGAKVVQK